MLTPMTIAIYGGGCVVLNIIIFLLIMAISDGWGCPKK